MQFSRLLPVSALLTSAAAFVLTAPFVNHTALGDCANTRYILTTDTVSGAAVQSNGGPTDNPTPVDTKTVEYGMTIDQVKQAHGIPDKIVKLGSKTFFLYNDMKVIFKNSKVVVVQYKFKAVPASTQDVSDDDNK
ncbi:MAG: hypothetical protein ABSE51_22715 [Terracidiphilus sp.]|jgi:hypothetical protein